MERKVKILSVKKNEIIIKVKKKQKLFAWSPLIVIALFFLIFASGNNVLTGFKDAIKVVSPVTPLYSDNSNAIFTNAGIFNKDTLSLSVPVKNSSYEILPNGEVEFVIGDYIMVTACESGIVSNLGNSLDGVKFITIKHNNDIETTIENVDIIGVKRGDVVKAGQDIATAKPHSKLTLKIYQNGNLNKNFKIQKSKILWEN